MKRSLDAANVQRGTFNPIKGTIVERERFAGGVARSGNPAQRDLTPQALRPGMPTTTQQRLMQSQSMKTTDLASGPMPVPSSRRAVNS